MALNAYLTQTQRLLHDATNQFYPAADLTSYINTARSQIAAEGQCVRVLVPAAGPITGVSVVSGGTNYSAPTITASGGIGSGATFTGTVVSGTISSIAVVTQGISYLQPSITITDPTGSGASASALQSGVLNTVVNQEAYSFATASTIAALQSGVSSIVDVVTVSPYWGGLKPTIDEWIWSDFQAQLRSYSFTTSGQPCIWSKYQRGVGGSLYLWPIPNVVQPMDWDCICTPIALASDADPEAIPYPWSDCIPYFAAYLALMNARRPQEAANMFKIYTEFMTRARSFSDSSFVPSYYV